MTVRQLQLEFDKLWPLPSIPFLWHAWEQVGQADQPQSQLLPTCRLPEASIRPHFFYVILYCSVSVFFVVDCLSVCLVCRCIFFLHFYSSVYFSCHWSTMLFAFLSITLLSFRIFFCHPVFRSCRMSTVCPRSLEPFCIVSYYIKWVKPSWTYSLWISFS